MSGTERLLVILIAMSVLGAGSYLGYVFMGDDAMEVEAAESSGILDVDVSDEDLTQARRKHRAIRPPEDVKPVTAAETKKPARIVVASETTIVGTITLGDDVPVEGATIKSQLYFPDALPNYGTVNTHKAEDTSGPEGRFSLTVPGHGLYRVTVSHPELAPVVIEKVKAGADLEVKMTPGALLTGVIRGKASGKAVAGASLSLRKHGVNWSLKVKSDDEGKFAFRGVFPDTLYLSIDHDAYVPIRDEEISLSLEEPLEKEIRLDEGKTIRGSIKDPRTQFVVGAVVKIGKKQGVSNEIGEFEVSGLATSQHSIQIESDRFLTYHQQVNLSGSRKEAVLEVKLSEGGVIEGTVISDTGDLLAGVEIKAFETWGSDHMWESGNTRYKTKTDKDGRFRLTGFQQNSWSGYALRARSKGYADSYSKQIKIKDIKKPVSVQLVLGDGGTIAGKVTNRDNEPVAGAKLSLNLHNVYEWSSNGGNSIKTCISDENGHYKFTGLGPRKYRISLIAPGYASQYKSGMEIRGAMVLDNQDFILEGGDPIKGTVKNEEGEGIPKVWVSIWSKKSYARAVTDEKGEYVITNLSDGPFTATASTKGYSHERKKDTYPENGRIDFELKRNGYVWGTVRDKETKKPVRQYRVYLKAQDARRGGGRWVTKAQTWVNSPDGKFKLYVKDGTYKLEIRSQGHILYEKDGVNISVDGEPDELEIALIPGGSIEGWIKDSNGQGMPHVEVFAREMVGTEERLFRQRTRTERDGYFYLDSMKAGSYELAFKRDGVIPIIVKSYVTVLGGELRLINVDVPFPSPVHIYVQDEKENPLRSLSVAITSLDNNPVSMIYHRWDRERGSIYKLGFHRSRWMNSTNGMTLRDLPAGRYKVSVRRGGYLPWSDEIVVRNGDPLELVITLKKPKKKKRS